MAAYVGAIVRENDWKQGNLKLAWRFGVADSALFFHADKQVDNVTFERDVIAEGWRHA